VTTAAASRAMRSVRATRYVTAFREGGSLPGLVDPVITHGGNNTTTEAFHFGKPMIVLPLFWDQYDNAQRMDELGLGVRLDTYRFTDAEMHGALDRLLGDARLGDRLQAAALVIQQRDGVRQAAGLIERAAGG